MSMKPLRQLLGLDLTLKRINEVTKNKKKLLTLQDFNPYFKLWALKHTLRQLQNRTVENTHDDYKILNNKISIK